MNPNTVAKPISLSEEFRSDFYHNEAAGTKYSMRSTSGNNEEGGENDKEIIDKN